ncbi:MAG: DUF2330 domain-containing protein [Deltaproteobacteria bacterium]
MPTPRAIAVALLAFPALLLARPSRACLTIAFGEPPKVTGEEVLILWDPGTQTEQLIRHLSFGDAQHEFGFVVPTPTRPTLGEVDGEIFSRLYALYRAPPPPARSTHALGGKSLSDFGQSQPLVELEHRQVAGLDATVLRASDEVALTGWLSGHRFSPTPAMTDYLRSYARRHWYFTAFRFVPVPGDGPSLRTRALAMSFGTDAPFFPYAEPADSPKVEGRRFRVTVIAGQRVHGELGGRPWRIEAGFADRLSKLELVELLGLWPALRQLREWSRWGWITTFEELSSIRGADDLRFVPDDSGGETPVPSWISGVIE